jgi:hypothetical protein
MASQTLWGEWTSLPQTVATPDELDSETNFNFFYGMPTHYYAGIYWGGLQVFRWNDYIYTELAWSRDGKNFQRLPTRPKLIEYGPEGTWDDTMIFASSRWVEVGDEWWVYYSGWDGPHGTEKRTGGIGLATFRKEGFISQHGPKDGGVVCTRALRWPGGTLRINADAGRGELRVRVSDERRKPIPGYDYDDGQVFNGNSVAHEVTWKDKTLDALTGQVIRLEFLLKDADLYTFKAVV